MKPSFSFSILLCCIGIFGCWKSSNQNTLDLSAQWQTDYSGNLVKGVSDPTDSQWKNRSLIAQELALFKSLDTADLSGTTEPLAISSVGFFPNPFSTQAQVYFAFSNGFIGQVKLKYVVVDKNMNPMERGTVSVGNTQPFFHWASNLPVGYYRIYFTVSSQARQNFYTSWGNIQRTQ